MSKYLINAIIEDKGWNELEKDFLTKMWLITYDWNELNSILSFMSISEKTEIKIREILFNIGEEIKQICELMIKEELK